MDVPWSKVWKQYRSTLYSEIDRPPAHAKLKAGERQVMHDMRRDHAKLFTGTKSSRWQCGQHRCA